MLPLVSRPSPPPPIVARALAKPQPGPVTRLQPSEALVGRRRRLLQDDVATLCAANVDDVTRLAAQARLGQRLTAHINAITDPGRRAEVRAAATRWFSALGQIARMPVREWLAGNEAVIRDVIEHPESRFARQSAFDSPGRPNNFFSALYRTQAPGVGVNERFFARLPPLDDQQNRDRVGVFMRAAVARSVTGRSGWAPDVVARVLEGASTQERSALPDPDIVRSALQQLVELTVAVESAPRALALAGVTPGPLAVFTGVAQWLPPLMRQMTGHPAVVALATGRSLEQILRGLPNLAPADLRAVMNLRVGDLAHTQSLWSWLRVVGINLIWGIQQFKPPEKPNGPGDDGGGGDKRPHGQLTSGGDAVDITYNPARQESKNRKGEPG
jgi:hypothetical protein